MARIGFIGLGVMGGPMAGHLVRAGHEVRAYNRTGEKAKAWAAQTGGVAVASVQDAARGAEFVLTCVGDDAALAAVMAQVFEVISPGTVLVDHSTVSAVLSRQLAAMALERGAAFLDAPVSGGQAGAQNGQLGVMVGGDGEAFARAEPIFAAYAKRVGHMGASGAGQLAKMVNQICIGGILQGLSEALIFAKAAGLTAEPLLSVLGQGAAQSWQMDNRARTMLAGEFDFGFAIDWMRKDLGLVLEEAGRLGVSLPTTALVDQFYAQVQALGGGRQDSSALIRRYEGAV